MKSPALHCIIASKFPVNLYIEKIAMVHKMANQLLMGNEAIALGAVHAGVGFVSGYPGTPSTEILETVARQNDGHIHVEWSVNEKSALEIAAGASYAGVRSMVTMKQVGLNVASDPLMSLAYIGVKGGMVIVVADDPGPISSQTEQDTRHFAQFSKLPVFDPASPEEAYEMVEDAFVLSEKYGTPVILRPTTRVCHGCGDVALKDKSENISPAGFEKDSRWVIFPKLSYQRHLDIETRNPEIGEAFSESRFNRIIGQGRKGIATGGISYAYVKESLELLASDCKILKIGTPHPFPESLALSFLQSVDEVLVVEELDPVIEKELLFLCGKHHLNVTIKGKYTSTTQLAGENTVESVQAAVADFLQVLAPESTERVLPELPVRPPVLCPGCPHRASFYAVKKAMVGKKAVFSGDIGCYTLGNAAPLNMVDTCLCMGAGVTIAQGLHKAEPDAVNFAFIGDSTFFHTGIPGVVNAVYNGHDIVLIVLDNATTAMTGHQPHPGIGKTMMGSVSEKIKIDEVLRALGVKHIQKADPLDLANAVQAVKSAAAFQGVSAVIFESPCIAVTKPSAPYAVDTAACIGCGACMKQLGCPAIVMDGDFARIERSMCFGCGLCAQVCPAAAIKKEANK